MSHTAELDQLHQIASSGTLEPQSLWKTLWKTVLVLALLGFLYFRILSKLAIQWWHDPNFSNGFFVPAFSIYVLWLKRHTLRKLPLSPSWWGVLVLVTGLGLLILGNIGAELFLSRFSLVMVTAGLVISFLGWTHQRQIGREHV